MSHRTRSWTVAAATVLAISAVPGAIVTIVTPGVANADVCRRGPTNIADAVRRTFRRPRTTPPCRTTRRRHRTSPVA